MLSLQAGEEDDYAQNSADMNFWARITAQMTQV